MMNTTSDGDSGDKPAAADSEAPLLFGTLPGALMYVRRYPAGVPDTHSIRVAHLHVAETGDAFSGVGSDERAALFDSLTKITASSACTPSMLTFTPQRQTQRIR
jgi:hypothetical protein